MEKTVNANPSPFRATYITLVVAALLGIIYDYFFHHQTLGLSFPLYIVLILISFAFLTRVYAVRLGATEAVLAAGALFFSFMVFVRSNAILTTMNLAITVYLLLLLAWKARGFVIWPDKIGGYARPLLLPFETIETFFRTAGGLRTHAAQAENRNLLSRLAIGLLFAIPVLLVFLFLFAAADLVFKNYVSDILDFLTLESAFRLVAITVVASAFLGLFVYLLDGTGPEEEEVSEPGFPADSRSVEATVVLVLVGLLFLAFIAIQFTYLFGADASLALPGVTYAEYARQGFFELLAVALLAFLLIWVMATHIWNRAQGYPLVFKILGGVLIAEVMVIMVSALRRLVLYEEAFGFTTARFFAHTAIYWLAAVLVFLAVKIVADRRDRTFLFGVLVTAVFFLAAVNLLNPDVYIARRNMERYERTGKIDPQYLSQLSDDAADELLPALALPAKTGSKKLAGHLYRRYQANLRAKRKTGWQSTQLARDRAQAVWRTRLPFLKANKDQRFPRSYETVYD